MSVVAFAVIAVAVCMASCMQASIGFGMGMLAAPVVALVDPALLPGTLIMSATVVTLMVVVREREGLDLRGTGWALVGRVPGTIAGALLLVWLPERGLALLLAAVVLGGVVLASLGWQPAPMRRNLATAGAASGLLGTATSIGGPPMALVLSGAENATVRSNLSAFFLVGSIMSMGALAATGNLHRDIAGVFVALIPAVVLGYVASRYVNRHLDKNRLRIVSIVVSTLGAVLLIAQQLL
ncbi:sulfite exporter TauE/SafE family protein [Gordonia hankookensis]|uniref:Probable membrane transporter protein n=1 Tax=Gordonia hankookensis TaxID=589403 RepID=A0ABR7WDH0_9ACTN|nr:sulfite exporter TauE/SafE family protein [Gordonia hankookensis]MBD1320685.1 sulfite exporter TauE/SafE family protein [Gordonia hankookensis]NDZ92753.1 sulfite exporter TauE/SafE family protein [Streptomyces sp. SID11726]NEB26677.1 sulfite exporter TauE/SafE family protein [Streptomyces sp. SID6673]